MMRLVALVQSINTLGIGMNQIILSTIYWQVRAQTYVFNLDVASSLEEEHFWIKTSCTTL